MGRSWSQSGQESEFAVPTMFCEVGFRLQRKFSSSKKKISRSIYSSKIMCKGFRTENSLNMEPLIPENDPDPVDILCEGLCLARQQLRARVQLLEDVRTYFEGILIEEEELRAAMERELNPLDIYNLLTDHFQYAEDLIGLNETIASGIPYLAKSLFEEMTKHEIFMLGCASWLLDERWRASGQGFKAWNMASGCFVENGVQRRVFLLDVVK
ncbi:hypothetical protein TNCV_2966221 [Trichonephila clavipes]|nr:hypothetical protein TNCV_2966221 [Trichonephila clavipes]